VASVVVVVGLMAAAVVVVASSSGGEMTGEIESVVAVKTYGYLLEKLDVVAVACSEFPGFPAKPRSRIA
jgi:hypothetical protein